MRAGFLKNGNVEDAKDVEVRIIMVRRDISELAGKIF
jgi:hypothetical protein